MPETQSNLIEIDTAETELAPHSSLSASPENKSTGLPPLSPTETGTDTLFVERTPRTLPDSATEMGCLSPNTDSGHLTDDIDSAGRPDSKSGKATGPRTAAGKARSSQNALLHGLTSKHPRLLSHEQPHHWLEHLEQYRVSYGPQNLTERDLVEDIAWFRWQLHRLSCVLAAVISMRLVGKKWQPDPDSHTDPNWHPIAKAFVEESGPDGAINTLNRYEARIQRDYHRSLNTLMRLRTHAELSQKLHAIPGVPAYIQDTRTPLPTEPEPPANPAPSLFTTNPGPTPSTANSDLPNEVMPLEEHPDYIELRDAIISSIRPYPDAFNSFINALDALSKQQKQDKAA